MRLVRRRRWCGASLGVPHGTVRSLQATVEDGGRRDALVRKAPFLVLTLSARRQALLRGFRGAGRVCRGRRCRRGGGCCRVDRRRACRCSRRLALACEDRTSRRSSSLRGRSRDRAPRHSVRGATTASPAILPFPQTVNPSTSARGERPDRRPQRHASLTGADTRCHRADRATPTVMAQGDTPRPEAKRKCKISAS
jgi:hypothetical protein